LIPAWLAVTGRNVNVAVVDANKPEPEFVYQRRREDVGLSKREDAILDRLLVGKVEVSAADAAAQRGCQAARAKGHVRLEVLKKEIDGELVLRVAEFAIPSGGEIGYRCRRRGCWW